MKFILLALTFSLVNFASAEDVEREISGFFSKSASDYAKTRTGDLNLTKIPKELLEDVISITYQREFVTLDQHQSGQHDHRTTNYIFEWNAAIFKCENGKLASIKNELAVGKYEPKQEPVYQFLVKNGKFELKGYKCSATGDYKEGVVKSMTGRCPFLEVGKNVYVYGSPYYTFPEVANACCEKKGCEQKVKVELIKYLNEQAQKEKPENRFKVFLK